MSFGSCTSKPASRLLVVKENLKGTGMVCQTAM